MSHLNAGKLQSLHSVTLELKCVLAYFYGLGPLKISHSLCVNSVQSPFKKCNNINSAFPSISGNANNSYLVSSFLFS